MAIIRPKINKWLEVSGSQRSLNWMRSAIEYLLMRDKSCKIEVIQLDIGNRYSGAGGWAQTEIQVSGSSSTPGCRVTRNGNRLIVGAGVSAIMLFSNINVWGASGQSEFDIITHRYRNGTKINELGDFSFVNGAWTQDAHSIKMFNDTQEGDEIRIYTVSGSSYEVLNWSAVYCMVLQSDVTPNEEIPEESTMLRLIKDLENYQPMWTEKQLFYSQNGTASNFTLSDSIVNYDALEITCCMNDGSWYTWTQRVNRLNRTTLQVNLETAYPSGTIYFKAAHVVFNGTTATVATDYQYYPGGSVTSDANVLIQEVKGIKYNYSDLPASEAVQTLIGLLRTTPGSLYNYTNSEQAIGTWVDGKTIYRKVVVVNDISSKNIDMGISGTIDTLVHYEFNYHRSDGGGQWRSVPWLYWDGNGYGSADWAGGQIIYSNGTVQLQIGNALTIGDKFICIIEYTKTS